MSGTQYDDPNRESLGLEPIWTGAGDVIEPQEAETKSKAKATKDDPEPEPDPEPKAKK